MTKFKTSFIHTIFILVSIFFFTAAKAQNDRYYVDNDILWPQLFVNVNLSEKTDWLVEYQWRRTNGFSNWQQSLLRTAFQYRPASNVSVAVGYGWIETFPYGDEYPLAANGTFPEHRIHEQVQLKHEWKNLGLTQRFRVEQRFVGRRSPAAEREITDWLFSHRFRHMLRLQHALQPANPKSIYVAAADEVFISAGKNVGVNIFDQNRLMFIAGKKFSPKFSFEIGYINQTVKQGRRIDNKTIMQNNNGLMLSSFLNF